MRARLVVVVLTALLAGHAMASHIVGGEFEIQHISGFTYRINLIIYFDKINGLPGAKDLSVNARIYRMADNARMRDVFLPLVSESDVSYTQPECSRGEIQTSKLIYTTTVVLAPDEYNHPDGYYLVWERCCRNYTITNIISQEPPNNDPNYPFAAGQTFYLEFPPVVKNGEPFVNSSPRLFPPLNDYACPRRPYYTDFAGVDDDGDSLVYSLVTPLNTHTSFAIPPTGPAPRPYPEVRWRAGFSLNNIMQGSPDLRISNDGFLTVTPTVQGLFVFAVKCEEYRNGVKIGEVRRDFQMLVLEACPQAEPPQIVGRKKGSASYSLPNQPLTVTFSSTTPDDDRCIQVRISDPDSEKPDDNFQERVFIRILPLNFRVSGRYLNQLLPPVSSAILTSGSTAEFNICLPLCPFTPDGNYQIGIIAYDDACSLPLSDTLVVNVLHEPPPNQRPVFTTSDVNLTINEGDPPLTIPIQAVDADTDQLDAFVLNDGFVFSQVGMTLNIATSPAGQLNGSLIWDSRCDVYDFTRKTSFYIRIIAEDRDVCNIPSADTMHIRLNIILPGNSDPVISSSLQTAQEKFITVTRKIYEALSFTVSGTDADNDLLVLRMEGIGFNPATHNAVFPEATSRGIVTSSFNWLPDCATIDLDKQNVFDYRFLVIDNANKCRFYKADTLIIRVVLEPPENQPPALTAASLNPEQTLINNTLTAILGSPIQISLTGTDADLLPLQDNLTIELIDATGNVAPAGYSFTASSGPSPVQASFTWNPDCSAFRHPVYENQYIFKFMVNDNRCFSALADTLELQLTLRDVAAYHDDFLPPNFFSPNGDLKNDFFGMYRWNEDIGEYESILPSDNCEGSFVSVRIFNRWGKEVFASNDRNFKWYGDGLPSGVYYYLLKYTHREYRGTITLRY